MQYTCHINFILMMVSRRDPVALHPPLNKKVFLPFLTLYAGETRQGSFLDYGGAYPNVAPATIFFQPTRRKQSMIAANSLMVQHSLNSKSRRYVEQCICDSRRNRQASVPLTTGFKKVLQSYKGEEMKILATYRPQGYKDRKINESFVSGGHPTGRSIGKSQVIIGNQTKLNFRPKESGRRREYRKPLELNKRVREHREFLSPWEDALMDEI